MLYDNIILYIYNIKNNIPEEYICLFILLNKKSEKKKYFSYSHPGILYKYPESKLHIMCVNLFEPQIKMFCIIKMQKLNFIIYLKDVFKYIIKQ